MTTRNPHPHSNSDHEFDGELPAHLPAHLASLAADLDRLAASEARDAGPSLEDRLFVRTRSAALHQGMTPEVRRMNDAMQADAARTLAEAPAGLEDRVFEQTVGIIRGENAVVGVIGSFRSTWVGRLALAASLAIAAVGGWAILKDSANPATTDSTTPIAVRPTTTDKVATVDKKAVEDVQTVLASTEAEEKFIALFAMSNDSLSADIKSAALDAEQLSGSLFPEPTENSTVGG